MITNLEKEIIENLKKFLNYDAPKITQEQFDNMVDYIMEKEVIEKNPKELVWRLCGCYEDLNFNKVIDLFVDSKDSYYTSELVSYVDGNLDQEYLTKKLISTNDLKFINDTISVCGNAITYYLDEKYINIIKRFCNKKL